MALYYNMIIHVCSLVLFLESDSERQTSACLPDCTDCITCLFHFFPTLAQSPEKTRGLESTGKAIRTLQMRESLNYSPVSGKKGGLDKRDNSMEQLTRRNDII